MSENKDIQKVETIKIKLNMKNSIGRFQLSNDLIYALL